MASREKRIADYMDLRLWKISQSLVAFSGRQGFEGKDILLRSVNESTCGFSI